MRVLLKITASVMLLILVSCAEDEGIIKKGREYGNTKPSPKAIVAGTSYLPEIEDVPLPNGFKVNGNSPFIFDTPFGRVVEVTAEGNSSSVHVYRFYDETLPQLGWKKKIGFYKGGLDMKFNKDHEELRVNIRPNRAKITIKFSLYPDPGKKN